MDLRASFQSKESTLVGASLGYVFNGKTLLGGGIASESDGNFTTTALRVHLGYLPIRQGDDNIPVSVGFSGFYQYNMFSDIDDLSSNTYAIGIGLYHEIKGSKNFDVILLGGVSWSRTVFTIVGYKEDFNDIGYNIGSYFIFSKKFYVLPNILFYDGDSALSLSLGIQFPK